MLSNHKLSPLLALCFLLAVAFCVSAEPRRAAQEAPHSGLAVGRKITQKGLPNLGQVTPTLYRGALPAPEGIQTLRNMSVDIVVDLRPGPHQSEEQTVNRLGMRYVSLPSLCYSPKDETFARFLAVVRNNPDKTIFVHCQLGEDRTGMAVAAYRMSEQGWSADEAMREMQAFGFSSVHHLMCPGLAAYEQNFPERLKANPAFQESYPKP